jgi:nucleotide-binding universal stress UspA family protein
MISPTLRQPMNILLADDGSRHAMAAVTLLTDLLKDETVRTRSTITLLNVFTPRQIADHEMLRAALDQSRALLETKGISAETEQVLGYPAEKIMEYAQQRRPDLIILGAKGLRATLGILLGGVTQQVVEYACCPVLVVRWPYEGLRRVLLVTDGSASSQNALEYLGGTTQRHPLPLPAETELKVMHVLPPLPTPEMVAGAWSMAPEAYAPLLIDMSEKPQWLIDEERQGQEILDQAVAALGSSGLAATGVLKQGDAATEIIEYVKDNQIDLVIAGSRGLSQMRAWLLGSVSRKLVHYAPCSVLIVKSADTG